MEVGDEGVDDLPLIAGVDEDARAPGSCADLPASRAAVAAFCCFVEISRALHGTGRGGSDTERSRFSVKR